MEEATKLANAVDSKDPRVGLRAVAALRRLLEQLEALQVANARAAGWSWPEIAAELGGSRPAVPKKHAGRRTGERPVGEECKSRAAPYHSNKTMCHHTHR